jgi:hypothetical protein
MSKAFQRTLSSYSDTRQVLKLKLRHLANLKTQLTYSDTSGEVEALKSVSSSRLQAKVSE